MCEGGGPSEGGSKPSSVSDPAPEQERSGVLGAAAQLCAAVPSWVCCSVGGLVFNKLAIGALHEPCVLLVGQFSFAVLAVTAVGWRSFHVGSWRDVLRWSVVVPFFTGRILTSVLALKFAPMALVVTLSGVKPMLSLVVERFYPEPGPVTLWMLLALGTMMLGIGVYVSGIDSGSTHWYGAAWAVVKSALSVADRNLQRLLLSERPVDMSKSAATFVNYLLGIGPLLIAALCTQEFARLPGIVPELSAWSWAWIAASYVVGTGVGYTTIWLQSLLPATTVMVLGSTSDFSIIFIEAVILRERSLGLRQIAGASVSILPGTAYGMAQQAAERQAAERKQRTSAAGAASKGGNPEAGIAGDGDNLEAGAGGREGGDVFAQERDGRAS